jgi:hypothetical protein
MDTNWSTTLDRRKIHQKLKNIARVISEIRTPEYPNAPTIIGG